METAALSLVEIDAWGLIVIIAFLLGMGTPYPGRKRGKERRNGNGERRQGPATQLDQIFDLVSILTNINRPADPEPPEDAEDGST